jgi:hypothetical protein
MLLVNQIGDKQMMDITVFRDFVNGEYRRVRVGFRGYDQAPLLLVYREYRLKEVGPVIWAEVLYKFDDEVSHPASFSEKQIKEEAKRLVSEGKKIDAIKHIRATMSIGLKEAKDYIDNAEYLK